MVTPTACALNALKNHQGSISYKVNKFISSLFKVAERSGRLNDSFNEIGYWRQLVDLQFPRLVCQMIDELVVVPVNPATASEKKMMASTEIVCPPGWTYMPGKNLPISSDYYSSRYTLGDVYYYEALDKVSNAPPTGTYNRSRRVAKQVMARKSSTFLHNLSTVRWTLDLVQNLLKCDNKVYDESIPESCGTVSGWFVYSGLPSLLGHVLSFIFDKPWTLKTKNPRLYSQWREATKFSLDTLELTGVRLQQIISGTRSSVGLLQLLESEGCVKEADSIRSKFPL